MCIPQLLMAVREEDYQLLVTGFVSSLQFFVGVQVERGRLMMNRMAQEERLIRQLAEPILSPLTGQPTAVCGADAPFELTRVLTPPPPIIFHFSFSLGCR